jgi:hypothetical protein
VTTISEVVVHMRATSARAAAAGAPAAAAAMGLLMVAEVTRDELARYSHPPGTATPSPPGEPPALVTGTLRRSVTMRGPAGRGGVAETQVGGTVIYARIQEMGGQAGRGHASTLPPRPYLKPAAHRLEASGALTKAAVAAFEHVTALT